MRGGAREGAGRPVGSGQYGEPTERVRVPVSHLPVVRAWLAGRKTSVTALGAIRADQNPRPLERPLLGIRASCGLPSPAEDHVEDTVDLNQQLVRNPPKTFYLTAEGSSMRGAGIVEGDTLIVDCSIEPQNGSVVVATMDGGWTVKMLDVRKDGSIWLMPRNRSAKPIQLTEDCDVGIWGVVTYVIKRMR